MLQIKKIAEDGVRNEDDRLDRNYFKFVDEIQKFNNEQQTSKLNNPNHKVSRNSGMELLKKYKI